MNKLKNLVLRLVALDSVRRVLHTFWQVASPILFTQLFMARSSQDVKSAVVVAGAAGLAAVKALVVGRRS